MYWGLPMMDCEPQESEATALTSESQPLLKSSAKKCKNIRPRNVAKFGREMLNNLAGKCCNVWPRNVNKFGREMLQSSAEKCCKVTRPNVFVSNSVIQIIWLEKADQIKICIKQYLSPS